MFSPLWPLFLYTGVYVIVEANIENLLSAVTYNIQITIHHYSLDINIWSSQNTHAALWYVQIRGLFDWALPQEAPSNFYSEPTLLLVRRAHPSSNLFQLCAERSLEEGHALPAERAQNRTVT